MSYGRFNPNDPYLIGPEWPATNVVEDPIDPSRELAHLITMSQNRTARNLNFYAPSPPQCGIDCVFTNWILATIYDQGRELVTGSKRETSVIVDGGNTTGAFSGGAVSVADALSEPDFVKAIVLDPGELVNIEFTAPFFLITNPRILDVAFEWYASAATVAAQTQVGYRLASANVIDLGTASAGTVSGITYQLRTGEIYLGGYDTVATPTEQRRRVWRPGDLTDLSSGTVHLQLLNVGAVATSINWAGATVTYCQENRVASGGLIRGRHPDLLWTPGWQAGIELQDPTTGAVGVPLLAGRSYTMSLTQAANRELLFEVPDPSPTRPIYAQSGDSRNIAALTPTEDSPIRCFAWPRLDDGRLGGPGVEVNRGYTMVLIDNTGASIDMGSQPYATVSTIENPFVAQEVLSTTGGLYASVRVTARKVGNPADLLIAVGQVTAILTSADFDALDHDSLGFATVTLPLSAPISMAAGAETSIVAVTFVATDHWEVPILNTTDNSLVYTSATYGGTLQTSSGFTIVDIPMLIQMAVPAVTGMSVGTGNLTLSPAVTGCPQPQGMFTSLEYTSICWGDIPLVSGAPPMASGAPLVSGFCAWDIERRDLDDANWRPIARVTDRDVRCVSDFEARFGVSTDYRVRLCRLDAACGDWAVVTGFVRAGPTSNGRACDGLVLTSNEDPVSTLAYPYAFDGVPTEDFQFVEAETVVLQRLHMRDYQVAFRPLERGGVRFSRTLLVNALSVPPRLLDEGFRDLSDLAWASLSYVAVLDTRGNRWFASVVVPAGSVRSSMDIYLASIDVVEVTNRPSVIDVEAV